MKKTYIEPEMCIEHVETEVICQTIAASTTEAVGSTMLDKEREDDFATDAFDLFKGF